MEQDQLQEQHGAENIADKAIGSSISTVNTSLLPTTLHQAVKRFDRDPPSHHTSSNCHGCTLARLRFLVEPCHYTVLASPLAYIRYAGGMEATGQG